MSLAALILVASLAAADAEPHPAPWYLPRSASLGVFINLPVVTPHVRVSWELGLLEQPRNHLVGVLTAGTGVGFALPQGLSSHYQHTLMAGLGYRSTREVLHWGFTVAAGALWYRAGFAQGSPYPFENRVVGYSEVTGRLGMKVAPHFVVGVLAGYAAPFEFSWTYPAEIFSGGVTVGLFADWR